MKFGEAFIQLLPRLDPAAQRRTEQESEGAGRRAGERYARGFDRSANESSTFARVAAVTAARATLVGSAAAAAAPGLLQLTAAVVPATGAMIALPAAMLAIKAVSGTVKLATLGVGEAINEGFTGSAEKAAEALKALPPEARQFSKSVIGLKGDLTSLRTVVSDRFFAPINDSMKPLTEKYLPLAQTQLPRISQAVGATAGQFAKAATQGKLFDGVNDTLGNTSLAIALANENVFSMSDALGNVLSVGSTALPRLGKGFADVSGNVSDFINKAAETGQLKVWLDQGIDTLKTLGSIVRNVGSIFYSVMQASNQSGGNLLTTLKDLTGQVADFLNSARGMEGLNATFRTMGEIGQGLRTGLGTALPAIAQSAAIAGPSIGQLAQVAGDLVVAVAPLLPYFTQLATLLLQLLIPALASLARFMAQHQTLMKVVATAVGAVVLAIKAYAAAQVVAAAVTKATTIATTAWAVITRAAAIASNVWAVAQWALNAAMAANPIGVVIAIIVALVAAIVIAYRNSETFRNIVQAAWKGIQAAAKFAWENVLKPTFAAIVSAAKTVGGWFTWLWRNALEPAWNGIKVVIGIAWVAIQGYFNFIKAAVNVLADIFMWLWRNVLSPVWAGIRLAIQIAWVAIQIIFRTIEIAVRALAMVFQWLWTNVIVPVWNGIRNSISAAWIWLNANVFQPIIRFVSGVFSTLWRTYATLVSTVWTAIRNAVMAAWNWMRDNVFNPLRNFITGALVNSWNAAKSAIINAWNAIKSPISSAWDWIKNNVFTPLNNFITKTIPNAFSTGVNAIGRAWDGIKEKAKVPVKFVVDTVINNGIIKGFNWIAEKVGAGTISPIRLGFATGGVLPGYTPGRDVHKFVGPAGQLELSGGEAIMRPEFTRGVGKQFIDEMNAAARTGGVGGVRKVMGQMLGQYSKGGVYKYDKGGIFGGIIGGVKKAWDTFTNPVESFKKGVNALTSGIPGGPWIKNTMQATVGKIVDGVAGWISEKFSSLGAMLGGDGKAGGWQAMAAAIKGAVAQTRITSAFRPGDPGYHGQGRAIDMVFSDGSERRGGGHALRAFNAIASRYGKNTKELIWDYSPWGLSTGIWNGGRHRFNSASSGPGSHNDHIHWAMRNGGIFKYDKGGWFNPGQLGVNHLRKPEAVLTPEESAGLKAMGTDKLIDLLIELIEAVREVAPGVGSAIRGSGRGLVNKARQA